MSTPNLEFHELPVDIHLLIADMIETPSDAVHIARARKNTSELYLARAYRIDRMGSAKTLLFGSKAGVVNAMKRLRNAGVSIDDELIDAAQVTTIPTHLAYFCIPRLTPLVASIIHNQPNAASFAVHNDTSLNIATTSPLVHRRIRATPVMHLMMVLQRTGDENMIPFLDHLLWRRADPSPAKRNRRCPVSALNLSLHANVPADATKFLLLHGGDFRARYRLSYKTRDVLSAVEFVKRAAASGNPSAKTKYAMILNYLAKA